MRSAKECDICDRTVATVDIHPSYPGRGWSYELDEVEPCEHICETTIEDWAAAECSSYADYMAGGW